jgi:hypothetical protein
MIMMVKTLKEENKLIGESQMEQSVTMKELKEVVKFAITFGEAADVILADGQFKIEELGLLMAPLMQLPAAVEGAGKIKLKDLSAEDKAELVKFIEEDFDIASDKSEAKIEKGLELVVAVSEYVKLFKKA